MPEPFKIERPKIVFGYFAPFSGMIESLPSDDSGFSRVVLSIPNADLEGYPPSIQLAMFVILASRITEAHSDKEAVTSLLRSLTPPA